MAQTPLWQFLRASMFMFEFFWNFLFSQALLCKFAGEHECSFWKSWKRGGFKPVYCISMIWRNIPPWRRVECFVTCTQVNGAKTNGSHSNEGEMKRLEEIIVKSLDGTTLYGRGGTWIEAKGSYTKTWSETGVILGKSTSDRLQKFPVIISQLKHQDSWF